MSNMNQMAAEGALNFAKNNQELVKRSGQAVGKMAYDNREAIGKVAYDNREVIADQAYKHRGEIASAAYQNQDFIQDAGRGYMEQQRNNPSAQNDPYGQQQPRGGGGGAYGGPGPAAGGPPNPGAAGMNPAAGQPGKPKITERVVTTCAGKTLVTANLAGLGLCAAGCALRFYHMFAADWAKPEDFNAGIFFMSTVFFILFIVLAGLSLLWTSSRVGLFVRANFHFLDYYLGRGLFLFFIGLFLLEVPEALEITLFVLVCLVVVVDLIVGCHEVRSRGAASEQAAEIQQNADRRKLEDDPYGYGAKAPPQPDNYGGDPYAAEPPNPSRAQQYQVQEPAASRPNDVQLAQNAERLDGRKFDEDADPYDT